MAPRGRRPHTDSYLRRHLPTELEADHASALARSAGPIATAIVLSARRGAPRRRRASGNLWARRREPTRKASRRRSGAALVSLHQYSDALRLGRWPGGVRPPNRGLLHARARRRRAGAGVRAHAGGPPASRRAVVRGGVRRAAALHGGARRLSAHAAQAPRARPHRAAARPLGHADRARRRRRRPSQPTRSSAPPSSPMWSGGPGSRWPTRSPGRSRRRRLPCRAGAGARRRRIPVEPPRRGTRRAHDPNNTQRPRQARRGRHARRRRHRSARGCAPRPPHGRRLPIAYPLGPFTRDGPTRSCARHPAVGVEVRLQPRGDRPQGLVPCSTAPRAATAAPRSASPPPPTACTSRAAASRAGRHGALRVPAAARTRAWSRSAAPTT